MELRQLKYFLRVAETLNFSVAARDLFITQSTLSQQILNLEHELDQQLFERNSHEVLLTEAGQMLVPLARECIYDADTLLLRVQELKQMLTGELNIGVTFSFSSMIAETMADFLRKYPKVKLNVCYASMTELINKLQRHELDLVLAFKPTEQNAHIESRVLFDNRLAAIVNDQHPLASKKSVTLQELEKFCLVLPAIGMQARNAFEQLIAAKDCHLRVKAASERGQSDDCIGSAEHERLRLKIKAEVSQVSLLFKLVHQTSYVTILAESTVINEAGLRAIPIEAPSNHMQGCIHTLKDAYQKPSAREFIQMLSQSTAILHNTTLAYM